MTTDDATSDPDALTTSSRPRKAREIGPGVHFLAGFGNTTFLVGRDAVAVVDPGLFVRSPTSRSAT
jgi:hypothetical protein